jgi:signal transduction histidine kinase
LDIAPPRNLSVDRQVTIAPTEPLTADTRAADYLPNYGSARIGLRIEALARQLTRIDGSRLRRAGSSARLALAQAPNAVTAVALLLAYVGLEWVSFIHEYKGVPVTPWNPGLGVAFAVLVLRGAAYGVVLFAGVLIAEIFVLRTELAWPVIAAMATCVSASFTAAAVFARLRLRLDIGLAHVRDVIVLLAAGAGAAAVSAALVSGLLISTDELTIGDLSRASLPLLVGDMIGIAVVTPLVLRLYWRWPDVSPRALAALLPEIILHALAIGLTLWLVVGAHSDYKFLSLLFLPVVAAALRHGIDGSCVALAATQFGLVALLHEYGYDAAAFTEFQVVMLVLTMSGLLVGVVVSERQRADLAARLAETRLKEMRAEAARAARMNIVGGMASALAHEINQPMTAARASARSVQQLLRAPKPDMERADANLGAMVAQIDHAGGVVRRIREFLRRGQPHFSTLDVATVLGDTLVLARPDAAANGVTMALDVADGLPTVFGDSIQLQQVVLNLVHNAVEAIVEANRADGCVRIGARRSDSGTAIEVSVADNGGGVPAGQQLFEPLSSSKPNGLGLGLSICASIVQAHGGRIWLQGSDATATEFRFSLPLETRGSA